MRLIRILLPAILTVLVTVVALRGPEVGTVALGNKLEAPKGETFLYPAHPLRVGDAFAGTLGTISNSTDEALVLKSIHLRGLNGETFSLMGLGVVRETDLLYRGLFRTFPPVTFEGKICRKAPVLSPEGLTVAPNNDFVIVLALTAKASGEMMLSGVEVEYESHGSSYRQFIPTGIRAEVASTGSALMLEAGEKNCAKKLDASVL